MKYQASIPTKKFPWSKIILSFLMISVFLIFATTGLDDAETVASWTENVGKIIIGTTIFSIATILLVWAGRLSPNNY
ncbi:MAG: hypothetical protein L3J58_08085 [Emcibacter sp.]|nr:hypothetical protein [Emcibacter sp.]